ncbi:nucleotide exchange factor GrpE [Candidatus Riesia pediculischaeffi]|uniref:Protein GrpE n=1 Tax=Candidatus Riesia pediculischaeffi TaxID=428411 RepID=A0A1V0HKF5_9ENTR|nr:nucleotide exchange factor GrpE [Candidatus Riesia pediculischaeffi]ARC53303.1 hypothetical protein AOQ87_01245 [Candidatus Riesia pediculischaeffi]
MNTIKDRKNHENKKFSVEEPKEMNSTKRDDVYEILKEDFSKKEEKYGSLIKELNEKLGSFEKREREIILRSKAEVENIIRRSEKNMEKAHKFALEKFSYDLLSVIDNLERSISLTKNAENGFSLILEGVQLTIRSFLSVIKKYGIRPIDVQIGEPFDPRFHEAVSTINSEEHQDNKIIDIVQKGYTIHSRLLRPSMVVVNAKKRE